MTKILYINRPNFDYIQDFIYIGLIEILGKKNVIEYPWNFKYHFNHRPYPKNIGLVKGNFLNSYFRKIDFDDIDAVIVASCHPFNMQKYLEIMDKIDKNTPRIFLDGGDFPEIAGDLSRLGGEDIYKEIISKHKFDLIFKREYLIDKIYDDNVFSLPLCFDLNNLPSKKETNFKYDVAFWAVETDPIRTKALEMLEDKFDCKSNGTMKSQVMSKYKRKGTFYLEELQSCKIGLNFRGGGWDTLRYWELSALGCFMISQRPQIEIENNFIDKEEIVYCKDDLSDLIELCKYYLEHEDERKRIGLNAKKKLEKYHTHIARTQFILDKIKQLP